MTKLTDDQMKFARGMTRRQWDTLRSLAMFPFYLSASERGDAELYALIQNKMAVCQMAMMTESGLPQWSATEAGKTAVDLRDRGRL